MNPPKTLSSLQSSSTAFSAGNYGDPRPPEVDNDTYNPQYLDTSVLDADPDTTHLLLEMFLSELKDGVSKEEGSGVREATPLDVDVETSLSSSVTSSGGSSPLNTNKVSLSAPLECTNSTDFTDPLDNPFLMEFTDIGELLSSTATSNVCDPTLTSGANPISSPIFTNAPVDPTIDDTTRNDSPQHLHLFDLSECTHLFTHTTTEVETNTLSSSASTPDDFNLDLSCVSGDDLTTLLNSPEEDFSVDNLSLLLAQTQDQSDHSYTESEPTTPLSTVSLEPDSPKQTVKCTRKRTASDAQCDDDTSLPVKKSKEDKYIIRREKNNEASKVSRAKRRQRHNTVFTCVTELETENAQLKIEVEEMEAETARLKKLLVERLSK